MVTEGEREKEREDKVEYMLVDSFVLGNLFLQAYTCKSEEHAGFSFVQVNWSILMQGQVLLLIISGNKVIFSLYACAAWYAGQFYSCQIGA